MRALRTAIVLLTTVVASTSCSSPEAPTPQDPSQLGLKNFAAPQPGIVTSGQPTEAQFAALPQAGVTRVLQLRPTGESGTGFEEAAAGKLGLEFVRLPVEGKSGLTRANVERFAAELAKPGTTTLVCCGSSNRVGALFALRAAWLDGKPVEDALAIGRAAGLKAMEPEVRALLTTPPK
jgi:uncharacterized protein (TIGR01244 family)